MGRKNFSKLQSLILGLKRGKEVFGKMEAELKADMQRMQLSLLQSWAAVNMVEIQAGNMEMFF